MGTKKKLTAFVSNWLGVIIAAVIVLVSGAFGGTYLYCRSRIDNALSVTTQAITLRPLDGLVKVGNIEEPPGYLFHIVLVVVNLYRDTIDISLSDVSIMLGTYSLPVMQNGSWEKSAATGYTYFEGDFVIDEDTFAILAKAGSVDVEIKGTIAGSGQYSFVKRGVTLPFNIRPGVLFQLTPPADATVTP